MVNQFKTMAGSERKEFGKLAKYIQVSKPVKKITLEITIYKSGEVKVKTIDVQS